MCFHIVFWLASPPWLGEVTSSPALGWYESSNCMCTVRHRHSPLRGVSPGMVWLPSRVVTDLLHVHRLFTFPAAPDGEMPAIQEAEKLGNA